MCFVGFHLLMRFVDNKHHLQLIYLIIFFYLVSSVFSLCVSVDMFSLHSHVPEGQTLGGVAVQHPGLKLQLFHVLILPLLMQQPAQQQPDSESTETTATVPDTIQLLVYWLQLLVCSNISLWGHKQRQVCVCVFVPQAQFNVVGHGVSQSLQDQSMLGLWQTAQVKSDHLQSNQTVICQLCTHAHIHTHAQTLCLTWLWKR